MACVCPYIKFSIYVYTHRYTYIIYIYTYTGGLFNMVRGVAPYSKKQMRFRITAPSMIRIFIARARVPLKMQCMLHTRDKDTSNMQCILHTQGKETPKMQCTLNTQDEDTQENAIHFTYPGQGYHQNAIPCTYSGEGYPLQCNSFCIPRTRVPPKIQFILHTQDKYIP